MPTWFTKKRDAQTVETELVSPVEGDGEVKSFFEHLDDLRSALFKMLAALFIGFNVCLVFANRLIVFLKWPLHRAFEHPEQMIQVQALYPSDSFILAMKIATYGGFILTMPVIGYFLARFVLPALKPNEKQILLPVLLSGVLLFLAGAAISFVWVVPKTLQAFVEYNDWMNKYSESLKIEQHWGIMAYLEFVIDFTMYMGLAFELPLVLLVLVQLGILSAETLRKGRKVGIAVSVIVAAIIAPPDAMGMIMMTIPLIALYEMTIWVAWFMERRKRRKV